MFDLASDQHGNNLVLSNMSCLQHIRSDKHFAQLFNGSFIPSTADMFAHLFRKEMQTASLTL